MKKIVATFAFLVVTLVSALCSAEIPAEEVALGGIPLGALPEYVKQIYGEPTSYDRGRDGIVIYNYNDTFKIMFSGGKFMYWMETTANNGIKTPSGIGVGNDASVLDKYGDTYYDRTEDGIRKKAYWASGRVLLVFGIKNGKIVSIRAAC